MTTQIDTAQRDITLVEDAQHPPDDGQPRARAPAVEEHLALSLEEAQPGTRFLLMAGRPYGEKPIYNGPYVD